MIKKLVSNPKMRLLLITVIIITGFIIVINVVVKGEDEAPTMPSHLTSEQPSRYQDEAVSKSVNTYNELTNRQRQLERHEAIQANESYLINPDEMNYDSYSHKEQPLIPVNKERNIQAERNDKPIKAQNNTLQKDSSYNYAITDNKTQTEQDRRAQETQVVYKSAEQLMNVWKSSGGSSMYLVQSDEDQQGQAMMDLQTMPSLITPGTILFAVLKNTVNSDQPRTPVMARIIAGPYKDATVLGNFTREDDRLVVRFTQLIPKGSAMPIYLNAYAIDPNTSETSVASDADHHYFSRYASLFAASFLQGFGQLFSQNNTEVVCNDGDVCTYTPVELSTRRGVYAGLGQVGEAISGEIRKNFNRAPTVTLERGTGVGVLVMSASYRSNSDEQKPFSEKNHEQTKQDER